MQVLGCLHKYSVVRGPMRVVWSILLLKLARGYLQGLYQMFRLGINQVIDGKTPSHSLDINNFLKQIVFSFMPIVSNSL